MWLTVDDVATYMGVLTVGDDRIGPATDAARTWVERQRPDLDYTLDVPADVHLAGILATALIYQQAASPSGLPSFEELGSYDDTGASLSMIYRLMGSRKPVLG